VLGELVRPEVRGLRLVEEEVDRTHGVEDTGGPDPRITTIEWGGALTGEANSQRSAERCVFVVEMLLANQVCGRRDRRHPLTQRRWHRSVVGTRGNV
jgi:hypothetical protein